MIYLVLVQAWLLCGVIADLWFIHDCPDRLEKKEQLSHIALMLALGPVALLFILFLELRDKLKGG